jgi:hypothetical protein
LSLSAVPSRSVLIRQFLPSGHFKEHCLAAGGKRGTGRASDLVIRGATSAPRQCSCLTAGSSALAASPGRGPDLRAHHPAAPPSCNRSGTVPSTLIRFMTRVPAREMEWIMQESVGGVDRFIFRPCHQAVTIASGVIPEACGGASATARAVRDPCRDASDWPSSSRCLIRHVHGMDPGSCLASFGCSTAAGMTR